MDKMLRVTHTRSMGKTPLATIHNLPGGDADMSPATMRALADVLLTAADECEARPMGKSFRAITRTYPL